MLDYLPVIGQVQYYYGDLECFNAYYAKEVFEQPQRLHYTCICHGTVMEGATGPTRDATVTTSDHVNHIDARPTVNDHHMHMLVIDVEGEDRAMFAQIGV